MSEYFSGGKGAHSRKRKYLNSSICDFTNFPGVEDLPVLKMKGLVKPPGCLRDVMFTNPYPTLHLLLLPQNVSYKINVYPPPMIIYVGDQKL
jgi:hypothetical protein